MGPLPPRFNTILIVFLFFFATVSHSQKLKTFTANYGPFNSSDYSRLIVLRLATIGIDALQVTPDTGNRPSVLDMANNSGRVLLPRHFKLFLKSNTSRIASFNSSFLINISPTGNNTSKGEGLAFVIVPKPDMPVASYGEYLGLTNSSLNGNSSNKFVAIEFDTHKQWYDPDNNHLGLNINNVISVQTVPLSPQGIDLAPMDGNPRFYNVWVNYDGIKKTIEVYMKEQNKTDPTPMIPSTPLLKADLNLREVVDQNSYIGFSASTGTATQVNCIRRWNITVEYFPNKSDERLKIGLGSGIPAVVVVVVAAIYCFWRKRRVNKVIASTIGEGLMRLPGMVREFEYGDLKKATDNFDDKFKLGKGGYGVVYMRNWLSKMGDMIDHVFT